MATCPDFDPPEPGVYHLPFYVGPDTFPVVAVDEDGELQTFATATEDTYPAVAARLWDALGGEQAAA